MTPAAAKNLAALAGKTVHVTFRDPDDDWPYYTLMDFCAVDHTILLRGADYPDGSAKHVGDCFWVDCGDVVEIKLVEVGEHD